MLLTEEQTLVSTLSEGIHLILATPGTGKTDILSQRIQIALQNGVQPEKMHLTESKILKKAQVRDSPIIFMFWQK